MNTKKFRFNKLVRDNIKTMLESNGCNVYAKELSDEDYIQALHDKLYEEVEELCEAESKEDVVKEIADIFQVLETICAMADISPEEILETQQKKIEKNGGFQEGIFIDYIEFPEGHKYTEYYESQPDKYPKITE